MVGVQALFENPKVRRRSRQPALLTPLRVSAGRTLTQLGEHGNEFFVIAEGTAKVWRFDECVGLLGAGDHFGEISLLADRPRTATVLAETEMDLLVANRREFWALLDADPRAARSLTRVALARLADLRA